MQTVLVVKVRLKHEPQLAESCHVICFLFSFFVTLCKLQIKPSVKLQIKPSVSDLGTSEALEWQLWEVNHLWHLSNTNSSGSRWRQYDLGRWQKVRNNMTPAILSQHWYPGCWSKYWRLCPLAPHHPRQQQVLGILPHTGWEAAISGREHNGHIFSYFPHWKWSRDPLPCTQT